MKSLFIAVVCAAAIPGAAFAQVNVIDDGRGAPPASQAVKSQKVSDDGKPLVCKRVGVTGSRLGGTKVCRSREEWAAISRDQKEQFDAHMRSNMANTPDG